MRCGDASKLELKSRTCTLCYFSMGFSACWKHYSPFWPTFAWLKGENPLQNTENPKQALAAQPTKVVTQPN